MTKRADPKSFIGSHGLPRKNGKSSSALGRKGSVGAPATAKIKNYLLKMTAGRPTKLTEEMIVMIKQCGLNDLNKKQTCYQCDIDEGTLREWFALYPRLEQMWKDAKSRNAVKAKMNVAQSIDSGDVKTSQWYLERTQGEEFSNKSNVVTEDKRVIPESELCE